MIPRIQARVGQATEPPEVAGKWFFEIFVSVLGGGEPESMGHIGPWDSEKEAHEEMRSCCKLLCEEWEKKMVGRSSGRYIDMKTNQERRWDRKDEH